MNIKIRYRACDGAASTKRFKTLAGAQSYAQLMIGETPEFGSSYAVSFDGIGTVRVEGASLRDLFPKAAAPLLEGEALHQAMIENEIVAEEPPMSYRAPGCTCTEYQLVQVGCDCGGAL